MKASAEFGWYNRNCAINPYLIEGKKTVTLELVDSSRDAARCNFRTGLWFQSAMAAPLAASGRDCRR